MHKFNVHSVDGVSTLKYTDLEQFENEWTDGRSASFDSGTYVTNDGISVIYPLNKCQPHSTSLFIE